MQCMMIWHHLNTNPSQKFCKNLNKFEKSQNFSKTPNFRSKDMKCMIKGWKRIIPEREANLEIENWVGEWILVKERSLGSWEVRNCREVSRFKTRESAVKELSRICREVSIAKGFQWIKKLSRIYQECDKKQLKSLDR